MQRIQSNMVAEHAGERIWVAGWLHAVRRLGGLTFVVVRDGWGMVQAVTNDPAVVAQLATLGTESIIRVTGQVEATPKAPGGAELHTPEIAVLVPVTEPVPVTLNKREVHANLATQLDHAVVLNRHPARRAILRLGAGAMQGYRAILTERGFTEIQSPKLVASATESGANVFKLDYFGRPAFLAQSPQFYKQMMVGVFERVFEVGPVFRARRKTPRATSTNMSAWTWSSASSRTISR